MGWYGHMGELDPYQLYCLEELRRAKLRPHTARLVLWSAGCRIMGDTRFSAQQRRQAGIYVETVMRAIDNLEQQDVYLGRIESSHMPELLDMGHMMGWAFLEIHNATFQHPFDPSDPGHQKIAVRMQLTVGNIEDHLTDAFRQYMTYEEAQAQNPAQTDVRWY